MSKKLLVLTLALVFIISLMAVGCGSSDSAGKEKVKIAYIGPITGPNAAIGLGLRNSVDLAVKQANESGELPYELEFLALDDASDPVTAVNAANKAASDPDVVAVVAHFNSGCALATKDVFHKYGLPAVVAAAINDQITKDGYPEITRVITPSKLQNVYAAEIATDKFGVSKISVIHDRTEYGKTNAEQFIEAAEANGAEILSFDGISVGQQDFSALLTKIKTQSPQMIFFGGVATEAALIKRQIAEMGIDTIFMSDSGILSQTFVEIAGEYADGTLSHGLSSPIEDLPKGKEYHDAYEKAGFKEPYEAYGPFAYDAANVIIEALKKVEEPDRESMIEAIRNTEYDGVLGKTSFDEDGQSKLKTVYTYVVQDGEWILLENSKYKIENGKMQ